MIWLRKKAEETKAKPLLRGGVSVPYFLLIVGRLTAGHVPS